MERIQEILLENAKLQAAIIAKDKLLSEKDELLLHRDKQLVQKNERILYLERQLYGRRSEKRLPFWDKAQLSLFSQEEGRLSVLEEEEGVSSIVKTVKEEAEKRRKNRTKKNNRPGTYAIPADIERREQVLLPEGIDAGQLVKIGEDVEETLEYTPGTFWVKRIVRPVFKAKEESSSQLQTTFYQAPGQASVLPGCIAGNSLLAQIVIDKFEYHLPEHRQRERFKDLGVRLSSSNINRWIHELADRIYPLYYWQMQSVLDSSYIQMDETTIPVADRPGKSRKAYLWAARSAGSKSPPGMFFYYDKGSRSQDVIIKLLRDYKGALQTDGYTGYNIYEDKKDVLLLGCLAHVRRKFETAFNAGYTDAVKALDYISVLYMLEANLKDENADETQILQQRKEKAYPILQALEQWMVETFNKTTPGTSLGKAVSYAFTMLPRIARYTSQAEFKLDNNLIENRIRPITLGRKNYLFAQNNKGAETLALFYTLIGSCKEADINPTLWLTDVLNRMDQFQGEELTKLLPGNWKKLQQ